MQQEKEHIIIGTAGHIDHGKTALVKALTGVDCDTLTEEKKRGITIELGFAFMDAPEFDKQIVFIDVPGHEKLVKTMVAGASNLDAAMLVIAADEGVNVQTIEHFDILQLLGIKTGLVALTKSDIVNDERILEVTAEVRAFVAGTFLEGAPVIPVSAFSGAGISDLRIALIQAAKGVAKRGDSGIFRMPVDRVFTMHGFGTVIAGTVLGGEVKPGDKLEILPEGFAARVRGVQVHGKSVGISGVGKRTAINLQDVKKDQLRRGQCACAPGTITPTSRLDAHLKVLSSCAEELKNRTRVRFHIGTDEVMARLVLLDCDSVQPGGTALAQFVLESSTTALPKDRYVIRTFSSMQTIGGGTIVDAHPTHHKRFDEDAMDSLEKRMGGIEDALEQAFLKSGAEPLSVADAATALGEREDEVCVVIDQLHERGILARVQPRKEPESRDLKRETYLHAQVFDELSEKATRVIDDYYSKNPYRVFVPLADIQSRFLKSASKPVYEAVMVSLFTSGKLKLKGSKAAAAYRKIDWKPGEEQLAGRIERIFENSGYAAPLEDEVREQMKVPQAAFDNIMTALVDMGRLVRLDDKVTYHKNHVVAAKQLIADHISCNGGVTAAELRDVLGLSRKYSIALLEYFDNIQFTRRLGDKRILRQRTDSGGKNE